MSQITWDTVGNRKFESGIDRGVLYLSDGTGVGWNGMTGISEEPSGAEVIPYYLDGVKFLDVIGATDYAATLTAFTYPPEFEQFDGVADVGGGLFLDNQVPGTFGLSYRTKVGNDEDSDYGYKIHLLYNVTATPTNKAYTSIGKTADPSVFSWALSAVPEYIAGFRPTAHAIIDSTTTSANVLAMIESYLYGTDDGDPYLPELSDIKDYLSDGITVPDNPSAPSSDVIFFGGTPGSVAPPYPDLVFNGGTP